MHACMQRMFGPGLSQDIPCRSMSYDSMICSSRDLDFGLKHVNHLNMDIGVAFEGQKDAMCQTFFGWVLFHLSWRSDFARSLVL